MRQALRAGCELSCYVKLVMLMFPHDPLRCYDLHWIYTALFPPQGLLSVSVNTSENDMDHVVDQLCVFRLLLTTLPPPPSPPKQQLSPERWKEAIELLEEMIAAGNDSNGGPKVTPSVVSYNAAITACSRASKVPAALRLLGEMSSRSGLSPDIYSYAAVMSGLAKARNPGRAIELLGEMRAAGMEPDLVCLKGAMEACRSKGAPKEAGVVLEQVGGAACCLASVKEKLLWCVWRKPNLVGGLKMGRMVRRGERVLVCRSCAWPAAENQPYRDIPCQSSVRCIDLGPHSPPPPPRQNQVRELDPTPSASTMADVLTSAIAACVTEGAWEQATDWLTDIRMARGGRLPPPEAYAAAANACARAGQGVRARALIAELDNGGKDEAQRPTLECYNAVVLGSAMAGDPKEALRTLKVDVPQAGLKPNTQGFNHVLQGLAKVGDWKTAITVLNEQRSGGVLAGGLPSGGNRSVLWWRFSCVVVRSSGLNLDCGSFV